MQQISLTGNAIKNIAMFGEKLPLPIYFITAVSIISGFSLAAYFNVEMYFGLAVIGVALLWIMIHYPKVWIYCVVIGCVLFFEEDEKGISAVDVFASVLFCLFLIIWFINKIFVKVEKKFTTNNGQSTLKTTILSEKLFLLFFFFLLFNCVIAVANGIPFIEWIKEFMFYIIMLYYFPVRDYFNDKKSIIILLLIFACVAIRFDIRQIIMFAKLLGNVKMAWEIGLTEWKINHEFYSAVILIGTTIFLFMKNKIGQIFTYFIVLLTTFTLISTFARAYMLAVVFLMLVLCVYLRPKQFLQLLAVIILTFATFFIALEIYFPAQSKMVQQFVINKIETSTQGKKDQSVDSRFREYQEVAKEIYQAPIHGHGLRKEFSFYFAVKGYNERKSFIHNGYLDAIHKTGIPMALLFYTVMILFNIRGYIVAWKLKRYCAKNRINKRDQLHFWTALVIGSSLTITMLFIANMVTSSFTVRSSLIVVAFSLAFVSIAEKKYNIAINSNKF
ncbi:MAG: O-antigen ligase family protein [Bacteroidetes bacterium]|nr:O-antigen ligase family protein [Bacteroidota bacterium]